MELTVRHNKLRFTSSANERETCSTQKCSTQTATLPPPFSLSSFNRSRIPETGSPFPRSGGGLIYRSLNKLFTALAYSELKHKTYLYTDTITHNIARKDLARQYKYNLTTEMAVSGVQIVAWNMRRNLYILYKIAKTRQGNVESTAFKKVLGISKTYTHSVEHAEA
jgi:hypothetical protein